MYQMAHSPHLYVQINPRIPNHNDFYIYGRMTSDAHYFDEPLIFNNRNPSIEQTRDVCDINEYNKNGIVQKKNGFWVSKRGIKSVYNGNHQTPQECESDDSSISSLTSVHNKSNERDNSKKIINDSLMHKTNYSHYIPHFYNGNAYEFNPRIAPHQQSMLFHNKRRTHPNRGAHQGRPMSTVRYIANPRPVSFIYNIAPDRFLNRAHLMQVRETPKNLLTGSMWDTLSQNMWNKFLDCQQTEETFKKKMKLWRYLYVTIKSMSARYSLYLVGSTTSGFGADSSDMDLCLLVKCQESADARSQAVEHLNAVYYLIKDVFYRTEVIQAKVPILKLHDSCFLLEVDINCNNIVGIRNTHLLYCYSQLDWRVRPLVLIVKLWAQHNNINDAKNRTISSYSYVLMVIHFLQCGTQPHVLPCLQAEMPSKFSNDVNIHHIDIQEKMPPYKSENNQTLGELFYGFLQYYTYFEYSKYAISVRTGKLINVEECRAAHRHEPHQWKYLCVEEPFDLSNTARSVYDADVFAHIRKIFEISKQALEKSPLLASILPPGKKTR